jgi:hypothetical protein
LHLTIEQSLYQFLLQLQLLKFVQFPLLLHTLILFESILKHFVIEQSGPNQFDLQLQLFFDVQFPFPEQTDESFDKILLQ